jgi:hypothetical protein
VDPECTAVEGVPTHSALLSPRSPRVFEKGEDSNVRIGEEGRELYPLAPYLEKSVSHTKILLSPYHLSFSGHLPVREQVAVA